MSSRPNAAAKNAAAGPPPERKAPAGAVLTPQVLMVVYFLIILVGAIVYWNSVIKKSQEDLAAAASRITAANTQRQTYQKKGDKLEVAKKLNVTIRDKLRDVAYMFMTDQSSVIPFWEDVFLPVLNASRLQPTEDSKFTVSQYTFKVNMAMEPFATLPPTPFFENADNLFKIEYIPEQGGVPIETPLDTRPADFLSPYTIKLEGFLGTYEDVQDFVERLQVKQDKTLFTVHCYTNVEDKNVYSYRALSQWTIHLSVYFINPEGNATGDTPPSLPGAESC